MTTRVQHASELGVFCWLHICFVYLGLLTPSRPQQPLLVAHASRMTLLAGSYERFLFGLKVASNSQGDESAQLSRSFTHAAHKGVVKCVAAAGQWAATGGADDLIHLYDLKSGKDLGFLMSPGEGAVTALAFFAPVAAYNPTHLLSGSADGSLSVWVAGGGWESMKTMRGHRKEVSAISVHPSGLLALTVSRDCCLRMWDLVKGRCTYTTKLEAEAEAVAFSQEDGGLRYAMLCGSQLTVHSVQGGTGVVALLSHPRRVLCMAWAPGNRIVTGSEDGSLRLWDAQAGVELLCISRAHASRVRALTLVDPSSSGSGSGEDGSSGGTGGGDEVAGQQQGQQDARLLVATCSTDGSVKLWDLSKAAAAGVPTGASGGACLAETQTRARLTCLAATDSAEVMQQRLTAAAAARQKQARAAAAQEQKQQQQEAAAGGKKRKVGDAAAAAGEGSQQQQQRKKQKQASAGAEQLQRPSGGKGKGKPGKGKPDKLDKAAAAAAAAAKREARVMVHDGVVEFLDSPEQAARQLKKQAAVQQKLRHSAQHGKRFRSVPGEKPPVGQGGRPRPSGATKQRR